MTMTMIMINGQNQNKLFMGEKGLLYMVGVKNLLPKSLPPTPPPFTDGFRKKVFQSEYRKTSLQNDTDYGMIGGDDNKRVVGMQGPVLLPVSHLLPNDDEENGDEATMMIVMVTPHQHKLSIAVFTVD